MKKASVLMLLLLALGCHQGVLNQSRQFEKAIRAEALSTDGKETTFQMSCYYQLTSKSEKLFDEKGYFVDDTFDISHLIEIVTRTAVRNIAGRHTLENLKAMDRHQLQEDILSEVKIIEVDSSSRKGLDIQFNAILFE